MDRTRFDVLKGLKRHDRALGMLKKSDIYPLMLFDTLQKIRDTSCGMFGFFGRNLFGRYPSYLFVLGYDRYDKNHTSQVIHSKKLDRLKNDKKWIVVDVFDADLIRRLSQTNYDRAVLVNSKGKIVDPCAQILLPQNYPGKNGHSLESRVNNDRLAAVAQTASSLLKETLVYTLQKGVISLYVNDRLVVNDGLVSSD